MIGDAAHATTPNLGQGACQAIEDAYVLGNLFAKGKPAQEVFAQDEKLRIKKAHAIVRTIWHIGNAAQFENVLAILLRNTGIRLIPKCLGRIQLEKIFNIDYNFR